MGKFHHLTVQWCYFITQYVEDRLYRAVSAIQPTINGPPTPPYQRQEHGSVLLQWFQRSRSLWMKQLQLCFQPAGNPPPPRPCIKSIQSNFSLRRKIVHAYTPWSYLLVERPSSQRHTSFLLCLCLAGINQGSCYRINHFPDDNDYDTDSSEYLLRECLTADRPTVGSPLSLSGSGTTGDECGSNQAIIINVVTDKMKRAWCPAFILKRHWLIRC